MCCSLHIIEGYMTHNGTSLDSIERAANEYCAAHPPKSSRRAIRSVLDAICRLRVRGLTWDEIADICHQAGITSPSGKPLSSQQVRHCFASLKGPAQVRAMTRQGSPASMHPSSRLPPSKAQPLPQGVPPPKQRTSNLRELLPDGHPDLGTGTVINV